MDHCSRALILTFCAFIRACVKFVLHVLHLMFTKQAKAFELSYLEKVPEVKDTVHKQSLLHHVCTMVVENFPDSSDLYSEIGAVTRSAKVRLWSTAGRVVALLHSSLWSSGLLSKMAKCCAGVCEYDLSDTISEGPLRLFSHGWFPVRFFPTKVCGASLPSWS